MKATKSLPDVQKCNNDLKQSELTFLMTDKLVYTQYTLEPIYIIFVQI